MNYIKHLTGFFEKIKSEESLLPTHISLYMALFQCWNVNRFSNPTRISSEEIMMASKIYSRATYHKCLSKLVILGLLEYRPSYSALSGSFIVMKNLSSEIKNLKNADTTTSITEQRTKQLTEQQTEQLPEQLYIYNINKQSKNNSNITNIDISKNQKNSDVQILNDVKTSEEEKKSSAKKKENHLPPNLNQSLEFFLEKNIDESEAKRFFSYYESKGWLVGNSVMQNWRAAAEHWILNMKKFNPEKAQLSPGVLKAKTLKNYDEPL